LKYFFGNDHWGGKVNRHNQECCTTVNKLIPHPNKMLHGFVHYFFNLFGVKKQGVDPHLHTHQQGREISRRMHRRGNGFYAFILSGEQISAFQEKLYGWRVVYIRFGQAVDLFEPGNNWFACVGCIFVEEYHFAAKGFGLNRERKRGDHNIRIESIDHRILTFEPQPGIAIIRSGAGFE